LLFSQYHFSNNSKDHYGNGPNGIEP
jgi:hypothetical protein